MVSLRMDDTFMTVLNDSDLASRLLACILLADMVSIIKKQKCSVTYYLGFPTFKWLIPNVIPLSVSDRPPTPRDASYPVSHPSYSKPDPSINPTPRKPRTHFLVHILKLPTKHRLKSPLSPICPTSLLANIAVSANGSLIVEFRSQIV